VVETHVENRKEEQIEALQALHQAKGEEVSTEAPSSSTLILKMPYKPRVPISVHDSLLDEKLFENTQRDLPRYRDIRNYLFVDKIILFGLREEKIGASNLNLRVREH